MRRWRQEDGDQLCIGGSLLGSATCENVAHLHKEYIVQNVLKEYIVL